ncbi:MAG: hypothetical protein HY717_05700 [Planctomycetes bacterium]|nr:hypothetical protein [Planctomycetota bacterium]
MPTFLGYMVKTAATVAIFFLLALSPRPLRTGCSAASGFTIVFDRGGYSSRLFVKLIAGGFDLITYRRGR